MLLGLAGGAALTAAQAARANRYRVRPRPRRRSRIGRRRQRRHLHLRPVAERPATEQGIEAARRGRPVADGRRPRPLRRREPLRDEGRQGRPTVQHRIGVRARRVRHGHRTHDFDAPHLRAAGSPEPDRADEITINAKTARLSGLAGRNPRHQPARVPPERVRRNRTSAPRRTGRTCACTSSGSASSPRSSSSRNPNGSRASFSRRRSEQRFPDSDFYLNEWVRLRRRTRRSRRAPPSRHADQPRRLPRSTCRSHRPAIASSKVNRANDPLVNGSVDPRGAGRARRHPARRASRSGASFSARANDHAQLRAIGATRRSDSWPRSRPSSAVALLAAVSRRGHRVAVLAAHADRRRAGRRASPRFLVGSRAQRRRDRRRSSSEPCSRRFPRFSAVAFDARAPGQRGGRRAGPRASRVSRSRRSVPGSVRRRPSGPASRCSRAGARPRPRFAAC